MFSLPDSVLILGHAHISLCIFTVLCVFYIFNVLDLILFSPNPLLECMYSVNTCMHFWDNNTIGLLCEYDTVNALF